MTQFMMRVYWEELGGHTHMKIFTGKEGFTLGKAGDLTFTNEEFRAWKGGEGFTNRLDGKIVVEFVEITADSKAGIGAAL